MSFGIVTDGFMKGMRKGKIQLIFLFNLKKDILK